MVFYYDIDIHFWILIGYISIYFGDTRDYLDRRRGQPRPPAKTILLVKNVLGLKFSPTSFILALVIKKSMYPHIEHISLDIRYPKQKLSRVKL